VLFAFLIKPQEDVMLNGQTFSSRTGKTSGLPKLIIAERLHKMISQLP